MHVQRETRVGVAAQTKLTIRPAPGNNTLALRLDAVNEVLQSFAEAGQPSLIFSPRMKTLRRGLGGEYRYRKLNVANADRYQEIPEKNEFSHVAVAMQYAFLGGGEYAAVTGRAKERDDGRRQTHAATEDNPAGTWEGGGKREQTHAVMD